jgi:hypothetical protein
LPLRWKSAYRQTLRAHRATNDCSISRLSGLLLQAFYTKEIFLSQNTQKPSGVTITEWLFFLTRAEVEKLSQTQRRQLVRACERVIQLASVVAETEASKRPRHPRRS